MGNALRALIALLISIARWANALTSRRLGTLASIAMSAAGQLLVSTRMGASITGICTQYMLFENNAVQDVSMKVDNYAGKQLSPN